MMAEIRKVFVFIGYLIWCISFCPGQEIIKKPTFPDVFQVEIQGVFQGDFVEMDATLWYDRTNNRAVMQYTYEGDTTKFILKFNENELLLIERNECTVSEILPGIFFPYTEDSNKTKTLGTPEEMFFFTNSTLDRQELTTLPSFIYTAKIAVPQYDQTNCDIIHIFSKPELELPDCDSHNCRSTLLAISVKCYNSEGQSEVDHTYNFFRFRSGIKDPNAFLPPPGVFCKAKSQKPFPDLPVYFSFSYDLIDEQEETEGNPGVFAVHKKVWYDSKLDIIRMDEFDGDGILIASRIFDFYGGVGYTSVASLSTCNKGPINEDVPLDVLTRLPKILFVDKSALKEAVYVGTRKIHALDYEVWSLFSYENETDARIVQDFYFTKNAQADGSEKSKISHVEIYTYERNDESKKIELSLFTYLSINNLVSKTRWEAFDVSQCFSSDQKKGFRLKVEGPPTVKDGKTYREILERLYIRLIIATNVSVIRLNEVAAEFDGLQITAFTGWILEKNNESGTETGKNEPDMNTAYKMIEDAAAAGKLSIKFKKDGKDLNYIVTAVEKAVHPKTNETEKGGSFSGGTVAAVGLGLFVTGIVLSATAYYVFIKKRKPTIDYKMHLSSMKG